MGNWFNTAISAGVTCQLDGVASDCLSIGNLPLAVPMSAGTPYALSVEYRFAGAENRWQLELWGTNADCGRDSTATLLASAYFKNGHHAACFDALPSANYSHLLLVESDATPGVEPRSVTLSYYRLPATFCPGGMCPKP